MTSDSDIMIRVQAGETSLFAELVRRYRPKLVRFVSSKLGSPADAEDVAQDALLAAFHARQTYSPEFAFSTWIWTITLNLTRRALKKRGQEAYRTIASGADVEDRFESHFQPIHVMLAAERTEQVARLLSNLPEPQADAIRLRFFGELTYQEIADAMSITVSGAKRRVKIGLTKLADVIDQDQ